LRGVTTPDNKESLQRNRGRDKKGRSKEKSALGSAQRGYVGDCARVIL